MFADDDANVLKHNFYKKQKYQSTEIGNRVCKATTAAAQNARNHVEFKFWNDNNDIYYFLKISCLWTKRPNELECSFYWSFIYLIKLLIFENNDNDKYIKM